MSPQIHTEIVIFPHDCLQRNCDQIVFYTIEGKEYFRCAREVFKHEIDHNLFQQIQKGILLSGKKIKGGFGAVPVANSRLAVTTCKLREDVTTEYSEKEMEVIECIA